MSVLRAISRTASFLRVLFVPVLVDSVCHLDQPSAIFGKFQDVCRGKKLDAVGRRIAQRLEQTRADENRHIMRLAIQHPRRLLRRSVRRGPAGRPMSADFWVVAFIGDNKQTGKTSK